MIDIVTKATGWIPEKYLFNWRHVQISLFVEGFGIALGPTELSIQYNTGDFPGDKANRVLKLTTQII